MRSVRPEEYAAERLAHLMDDEIRIPGTRMRFGLDPLIGLVPVVGDVIVTAAGGWILLTAQRLGVPRLTLTTMAFNLLLNGLIGSIPIFGDAFSFAYKCHAKNAAVLLRDVKQGQDGACAIVRPSLSYKDAVVVLTLVGPIVLVVGFIDLWLWQHDVSLLWFLFPPRYLSRTPS
jgi:hypothetical protein